MIKGTLIAESMRAGTELSGVRLVTRKITRVAGWYTDLHSTEETFVVYAGRVFRYPRGDSAGRAEAEAYGRSHGVPESQLDWPE
jgi:hypothetical protein